MPQTWTGTLSTNEFFNNLYNSYLLVQTFVDNLKGVDNSLASQFKTDADLYHDKFVYSDTNVLNLRDFNINDSNCLAAEDKGSVKQQEITTDCAKQIGFTAGNWLEKRAWQDSGSFAQFESELSSQVGQTRKLYEYQMVNATIGCLSSDKGKQTQTITVPSKSGKSKTGDTETVYTMSEALLRLQGETIANYMADLFFELKDPSTDYNDNEFYKSFNPGDLKVIWNSKYKNMINKMALPTIFDNAGLKSDFEGEMMLPKYFGHVNDESVTVADGKTIRAYEEMDYIVKSGASDTKHYKVGEVLDAGTVLVQDDEIVGPSYTVDEDVLCKIVAKDGIKYLSTIETNTEFFNPKNLTKNRYLTFAYARPEYLMARPMITLKIAYSE